MSLIGDSSSDSSTSTTYSTVTLPSSERDPTITASASLHSTYSQAAAPTDDSAYISCVDNDSACPGIPTFDYAIPYTQPVQGECDIYGPTCQTVGSVVVGLNNGSSASATVPCASYVSSQAKYISDYNAYFDLIAYKWPTGWLSRFGRSPECTSYAEALQSKISNIPGPGILTLTNCPTSVTTIASPGSDDPDFIPPGYRHENAFTDFYCCGLCSLSVAEVKVNINPL